MTYNFKSWTSDGLVQIDGLYSNYRLIASGSVYVYSVDELGGSTSLGGPGYSSYTTLTYPDTGKIPLIAIGDTGGRGLCLSYVSTGSVRLFLRSGGTQGWGTTASSAFGLAGSAAVATHLGKSSGSGVSIPYKIFAPVSATAASNDDYGLRMWGPNGELVYDSGLPTLNTVYFSTVTISNNQMSTNYHYYNNYPPRPVGYFNVDGGGTDYSDLGTWTNPSYSGAYIVVSDGQGNGNVPYVAQTAWPVNPNTVLHTGHCAKYVVQANGVFNVDIGVDVFSGFNVLTIGNALTFPHTIRFFRSTTLKRWAIK